MLLAATAHGLPIGELRNDGPATPEQLALFVPITGVLPLSATATVRYKLSGSSNWINAHSLFRIHPEFIANEYGQPKVDEGFAWPILDVLPGMPYDVEVKVTSGSEIEVKKATLATRAMPPPAPAASRFITDSMSTQKIQAVLDSAQPGDVIEFAAGHYDLDNQLVLNRRGTEDRPIYLRGVARDKVILHRSEAGRVLYGLDVGDYIIEDITLKGTGMDSGTQASSIGVQFYDGSPTQKRVTIRRVTMQGVDMGVIAYAAVEQVMVYNCSLNGNNRWEEAFTNTNIAWNDDGIRLPGAANVAFNNTLYAFGDSFAAASHGGAIVPARNQHFYRNEIINSGDDATEGDHALRNVTFYDNRIHNSMTFISLDPIYGGPYIAARNISVNTGRSPYKFNNTNTGHFIYNNTVIRTNGREGGWGWVQYNNGAQRAWGFENNILIYRGDGKLAALESPGHDPVDFTHNSFYPDRAFWWSNNGGSFESLSQAFVKLPATTPIFSGATQRHFQDNICDSNPFDNEIVLGKDFSTAVTQRYIPTPKDASAVSRSGAVIVGITDGYSNPAPDRGAVIRGRSLPLWGDLDNKILPPERPTNVRAELITE